MRYVVIFLLLTSVCQALTFDPDTAYVLRNYLNSRDWRGKCIPCAQPNSWGPLSPPSCWPNLIDYAKSLTEEGCMAVGKTENVFLENYLYFHGIEGVAWLAAEWRNEP